MKKENTVKKKNALILADTRSALVGNILLQLSGTNVGLFDEIIIYHKDMPTSDKKIMDSIFPCRFIAYVSPLPAYIFNEPRFKHFTEMMFCRYEMFGYLKEFETVTWLDTDIVIQGKLDGIIDCAKATGFAILSEDPKNKTSDSHDCMRTCFTQPPLEYDLDAYLLATGTISISDKLVINGDYVNWCYQKTVEWARILDLPDQGVFNALIQEFKINITALNGSNYARYPSYGRDCASAVIIHAWGNNKFWNDWYLYLQHPQWRECHEKWLAKGGSPLFGTAIAPKISVLIPIYKPELNWLKQALESLIYQKRSDWERFSDFEIILIAEPFDMKEIKYLVDSLDDSRITLVFNEKRLGISASLNRGGKLAKGSYIARIDADDIANEYRLYKQAVYLDENSHVHMCVSHFNYFGDMNESRITFEGEMSRAWSIFTCPFDHPTIMYRKDFFEKNNLFYDETRTHAEDWELWIRAFEKGMSVGCIQDTLTYHRWHTSNAGQSTKTAEAMFDLVASNFKKLNILIPNNLLGAVAPWQGMINADTFSLVEKIFAEGLRQNDKMNLYSQKCLEKAFALRLTEAKTGDISEIRMPIDVHAAEKVAVPQNVKPHRLGFLKRLAKRLIKPLYRPFRHRYEDRLIRIENSIWRLHENIDSRSEYINKSLSSTTDIIRQDISSASDPVNHNLNLKFEIIKQIIGSMSGSIHENIDESIESMRIGVGANLSSMSRSFNMEIDSINTNIIESMNSINNSIKTNTDTIDKNTTSLVNALSMSMDNAFEMANANINAIFKQMFEHVSTATHKNAQWSTDVLTNNFTNAMTNINSEFTILSRFVNEMQERNQQLKIWDSINFSEILMENKIFLIGTSEHSNIGDAAITAGEHEFVRKYFPKYKLIEISTYQFKDHYPLLRSLLGKDDILFLQGGGNLGNLYLREEEIRRQVISDFPNNETVILPQTIFFTDTIEGYNELKISREIYARHKKLKLFLRGAYSFEFAREHFPFADSQNTIDMAFMLSADYSYTRKGILLCIRDLNDESGLTENEYDKVHEIVCNIDKDYEKTNNLYETDIYYTIRRQVVQDELKKFCRHQVVVTDRLHGLIFSIITKTPCVLVSAYYPKNKEFAEKFADSNAVFFVDKDISRLEESINTAFSITEPSYPILNDNPFRQIFEFISS